MVTPHPSRRRLCRLLAATIVWLAFAMPGAIASAAPAPEAGAGPSAPIPAPGRPEALPVPVAEMREAILEAARSGDIEAMRVPLELNELPPMIGPAEGEGSGLDPITYWKRMSVAGNGRDILALLIELLEAGHVHLKGRAEGDVYVWPWFAEVPLDRLTPAQEVSLYRILPPAEAAAMVKNGRYSGYRLVIGADGVWHLFQKVAPR